VALEEISYEDYLKKLDQIEKRYLSDEEGFPEGAREKGLEICRKFRREVEVLGPEIVCTISIRCMTCPCTNPRRVLNS